MKMGKPCEHMKEIMEKKGKLQEIWKRMETYGNSIGKKWKIQENDGKW